MPSASREAECLVAVSSSRTSLSLAQGLHVDNRPMLISERESGARRRGCFPDALFSTSMGTAASCGSSHPGTARLLAPPQPAGGARREAKGAPASGPRFRLCGGRVPPTWWEHRQKGEALWAVSERQAVGQGAQPFCKYLFGSAGRCGVSLEQGHYLRREGKERAVLLPSRFVLKSTVSLCAIDFVAEND